MSKVSLTLGESKTTDDLTLESKDKTLTWNEADWTWDSRSSKWDTPGTELESKTLVDLTYAETK